MLCDIQIDIEVCDEEEVDFFAEGSIPHNVGQTKHSALVVWLVYLIAALQRKHYIPNIAVALLLKILSVVFSILSRMHPQLSDIKELLPTTMYSFRSFLDTKSCSFVRYVVCVKCHTLYSYKDCIDQCGTRVLINTCTSKTSKGLCRTPLAKPVQSTTGKEFIRPYKTFCYMPLRRLLQELLNRPDFSSHCEAWRTRKGNDELMSDVYDGKIWNDFQEYNGKPFLSQPYAYGLMLNIDWFKPYKHLEYSVGAIYLTIMNLPRQIRFKQENVLLIGLIPGPKEPKLSINSFLKPLVSELLDFFDGVHMTINGKSQSVRCALLCVACDIPASRKVCGFLGHTAKFGCSKCLKEFPGGVGEKDYSGFDLSKWPSRNNSQHRKNVHRILKCKTKTEQQNLESSLGCRYSALLDLPYFDPIRMVIIDPMHNLYLGTAKHVLKRLWHDNDLIDKKDYPLLQDCVDAVNVPPYLGRLPHKILSSFAGLTADQLKNWTNIFSLFALHNHLPHNDLECWRHFVLASRILSQLQISASDVQLAHALLLQFCKRVERMYGSSVITPNMHLHCHLKECLLDYGPVYSFWLFSFERYNGIFEHFPSSTRSLEIQLMHRFLCEFSLSSFSLPESFKSDFEEIFETVSTPVVVGSLKSTLQNQPHSMQEKNDWTYQAIEDNIEQPSSYTLSVFDQHHISELRTLFSILYPDMPSDQITINLAFRKYSIIRYAGNRYLSNAYKSSSQNTCITLAHHCFNTSIPSIRPVLVHFFAYMSFSHKENVYQHFLVCVSWLHEHPEKKAYGSPLELWWKDLYEPNMFSFIPIQCLIDNCAHMDTSYEDQTLLLICPIKNVKLL